MNQFKRFSAFFLAVMLVSVLGCASTATQEGTGEYVTDTWITGKVKAALVADDQVKATEVNVETFKGVVQVKNDMRVK